MKKLALALVFASLPVFASSLPSDYKGISCKELSVDYQSAKSSALDAMLKRAEMMEYNNRDSFSKMQMLKRQLRYEDMKSAIEVAAKDIDCNLSGVGGEK